MSPLSHVVLDGAYRLDADGRPCSHCAGPLSSGGFRDRAAEPPPSGGRETGGVAVGPAAPVPGRP
ncbi:hypothetical protein ACF068_28560 [Streptomyces sp. NPDC016309]|uniref:hypothetical protein n=1 Tax=Streptomyces sp. NPDC016309 TaxID=3364965 RepID=UPI0036FEDDE9